MFEMDICVDWDLQVLSRSFVEQGHCRAVATSGHVRIHQ